jgi:anti-anti-sigma factor
MTARGRAPGTVFCVPETKALSCADLPFGILGCMSTHDRDPSALPVVAPRGDLDANTLPPVVKELEIAGDRHEGVVLDAEGIDFADSTFLNVLLRFHHGTDLRLAAPSSAVRRLLEITGADAVLNIYPDVRAAQASTLGEPARTSDG